MLEKKTRRTKFYTEVMTLFQTAKGPLSITQLQTQLNKDGYAPNKSTLYRMMEKISKEHHLQAMTLKDGVTYYELCSKEHHHFICNDCDTVQCLETQDNNEEQALYKQLIPKNLKVSHHHLQVYGTCEPCQDK